MATEKTGTIPVQGSQPTTHTDPTVVSTTRPTVQADFAEAAQATASGNHVALPRGYVLQEYAVEAVLGVGGFGITYLAQDNNLQCRVAIKEYLPNDLAVRTGGQTVVPRTDSDSQGYRVGLDRFLAEARVLASFRHHNIVRVSRFFEANQTAYMVMDYEQGESLRSWVCSHGPADEATLLRMFLPLLEGLETVHRAGVVHRDIKPANIYVRDVDGSLVLLDFGAARQTSGASSKSLTSILTPGYAPFEQYHARGAQGPWTDLYALGGVLYWLVTGDKPVEAPSRVKDDPLRPAVAAGAGRFSEQFLRAIDWALSVDEALRPHSVAEFRPVLAGEAPVPQPRAIPAAVAATGVPAASEKSGGIKYALAGGAAALIAVAAFVATRPGDKPAQPAAPPSTIASVASGTAAPDAVASTTGKAGTGRQPAAPERLAAARPPAAAKSGAPKAASGKTVAAPAAAGATALLTFQIVPSGESAELTIDDRTIGRVPPIKEYRLPAGKHKIELEGNKRPHFYYYWVNVAPNETKNIWARFADD